LICKWITVTNLLDFQDDRGVEWLELMLKMISRHLRQPLYNIISLSIDS